MSDVSEGPRYITWEISTDNNQPGRIFPENMSMARGPMMSTGQAVEFVDSLAEHYATTLIFGGTEPLMRPEVFDLAEYARAKGLGVIIHTNGADFSPEAARRCVEAKVKSVQISLDGSSSRSHDGFRGTPGFGKAIKAIELIKLAGVKFEIASFITRENMNEIPKINTLAQKLGAWGHTFFFNIPTAWAGHLADQELPTEDYQHWLNWIFEQKYRLRINLKPICTPQFKRIIQQRGNELPDSINPLKSLAAMDALGPGCPGGKTHCYVAADGSVYPCAYTSHLAGNVTKSPFHKIWEGATIFQEFRQPGNLQDKCGRCEFSDTCGGCRAQAERTSGIVMAEDPTCPYQPAAKRSPRRRGRRKRGGLK